MVEYPLLVINMTKEELKSLKEYLKNNDFINNFGMYGRLYSMTTENIYGFLNKYDLKNKKVLAIAGSGDQRLNSYLLGAKKVTCFDINPLTELNIELKDRVIETLNFDEFLDFFGIINGRYDRNSILDFRLFDKFSILLESDTYDFYNYVIQNNKGKDIYFDGEDLSILKRINGYFNYDNYLRLRDIIKNKKIDFVHTDIYNLPNILNGEIFDVILLSNISDYIHQIYDGEDLRKFRDLIDRLKDNLNDDGIIQVGYVYSRYKKGEDVSCFHINKYRSKYFPIDEFNTDFVSSYYNDCTYDKVITYKKTKKC